MDWSQALAIIASNFVLFLWARSESRQETRMILRMVDAIQKEIKDFHGRLCAIEEKNKKS